jgi:hypothetical protein
MIKLVIGVTLGVVALALLVGSTSSSDESSADVVGDSYAYSSVGDPYAAGRQVAQEEPPLPVETPNSVVAAVLSMNTTPAPTVAVLKPIDVEPSDEVIKTVDKHGGTVLTVSFPDPCETREIKVGEVWKGGESERMYKDPDACHAAQRDAGFW